MLNLIALHAIATLGLNLFIGYAGQISLGHAAFFRAAARLVGHPHDGSRIRPGRPSH